MLCFARQQIYVHLTGKPSGDLKEDGGEQKGCHNSPTHIESKRIGRPTHIERKRIEKFICKTKDVFLLSPQQRIIAQK